MLESCNNIFDGGLVNIDEAKVIYVTKAGDDLAGNGSFQFPFLTIQKGLSEAYNIFALPNEPQNNPSTYSRPAVWVGAGIYTENIILPPQVQLWGVGKDYTILNGTITIDSKWSNYIPVNVLNQSDLRSTIINFQVDGQVDIAFDTFESNQGRLFSYNCRFTNRVEVSQKITGVVGNSYSSTDCDYGNNITFNGVPVLMKNCRVISWLGGLLGTVTLNQVLGSAADNYFETCGGLFKDIIINGNTSAAPPYYLVLDHQLAANATLTIDGKYAEVKSSVYSIPETANIILLNLAVASQIFKFLPFPEPQADWLETDVNSPNYILNKPSIFNIGFNSVNAAGNITTTSLTDVVATGMTITPPAGTYLVMFSSDMTNSTNNRTMNYSIYAGGIQVANSQRIHSINNNFERNAVHTSAVVTVTGVEAIDIRWRTSANTATMGNRILNLIKVS